MRKKSYDQEFKTTLVELLNSGKTVKSLSEEYGVSLASINRWKKELKTQGKLHTNLDSKETLRIKALEKELKETKLERDILKKAVSIFSKNDR